MIQNLTPYFFLSVSMLSLLLSNNKLIGMSFFLIAVTAGLFFNKLTFSSIPIITIFLFICYLIKNKSQNHYISISLTLLLVIFSIGLSIHMIPGFNNLRLLDNIVISSNTIPYTLWLNFDKPLIAIGFLWIFSERDQKDIFESLKTLVLIFPLSLLILMMLSFLLGYVHFEPKFPDIFLVWSFKVLFLTCFAEECLFRGFLWKLFNSFIKNPYVVLCFTSFFFGLAHFQGGWKYILLSTIAGFFYGFIYLKTKRIGFSISLHFLINTAHILFFSYPALK